MKVRFLALARSELDNASHGTTDKRWDLTPKLDCAKGDGLSVGRDGMIETIYHLSIMGRKAWHGL